MFGVPDELVALRDSVADFVEREVRPVEERYTEQLHTIGAIDPDQAEVERRTLRAKSAAAGFYAMQMPPEVGGMGVSQLGMVLCFEAIGRSGLLLAERGGVLPNVEGPTTVLMALPPALRERYLEPLMRGEREACFALSEPDSGSDATAMRTRARLEGDQWVINGRKHFITHGQYADFVQLFARTDDGITLFLVDADLPGVNVARVQHTIGADNPVELTFDDVRIPANHVIGEVGNGFAAGMSWINKGRIEIAALAVGKAQHLLDRMIDYAGQREAFGTPIGRHQMVQQQVVDSLIEVRACRALVYECADAIAAGRGARQAAAAAKVAATEMVARVADRAIQVHGGMGITTELGIERVYRDIRAMRVYEGTSEILRETIAKTVALA